MAEEEPRVNPVTGISNFARPESKLKRLVRKQRDAQSLEDYKRQNLEEQRKELAKREKAVERKEAKPLKIKIIKPKKSVVYFGGRKLEPRQKPTMRRMFGGILGIQRKSRPMADRLKVLRLQNMLEKKRLMNQIEKMKLQRRMELLRQKGKLTQVITMPIIRQPLYPPGFTQEVVGDINSMYNDLNPSPNDFWGDEKYYDEDFYTEEFYGKEFDTTPEEQLSIKPRRNLSPLLW